MAYGHALVVGPELRVSDRILERLAELGLSYNEIRVYLGLLEKGASNAPDLAQHTKVPYSKIYSVLRALIRKGWVEEREGRPTLYYARPPQVALESLRLAKEIEFRRLEQELLEELSPLLGKADYKERPEIWMVRGPSAIAEKALELISFCAQSLLMALPALSQELWGLLRPPLEGAKARGVEIRVLASSSIAPPLIKKLQVLGAVKVRDRLYGGGIVADSSKVLLLLIEGQSLLGVWTEHMALAKFAEEYFNYLWSSSEFPSGPLPG
ncbi:MAG: transcriptional regulator [Nitrososphaerota archaeon]